MEEVISWQEVVKKHQTISGVNFKNGIVNSLICGINKNDLYPNKIEKDKTIYYVGPSRQKAGINALLRSMEKGNTFMVFEKLGVDRWRALGEFKVSSHKKERGGRIVFRLDKALPRG